MKMQEITMNQYVAAKKNGYIQDIGQLTPPQKKLYDKQVKAGRWAKCKALWPGLVTGTLYKTTYVIMEAYHA